MQRWAWYVLCLLVAIGMLLAPMLLLSGCDPAPDSGLRHTSRWSCSCSDCVRDTPTPDLTDPEHWPTAMPRVGMP